MKLEGIKGIGKSAIQKLNERGIFTPMDLLCFFPYKYIDAVNLNRFDLTKQGESITALGKLTSLQLKRATGISYVKTQFVTENGIKYSATFFNRPYLARAMRNGNTYCINGKLKNKSTNEIYAPTLITTSRLRPIMPIYKKTGINASTLENAVLNIISNIELNDCLDAKTRCSFNLMDIREAFSQIHFPTSLELLNRARQSLSLENLAVFLKQFYMIKQLDSIGQCHFKGFKYPNKEFLSKLADCIDFELTPSQQNAISRITQLMDADKPMNTMLLGDVGSGKTIVCMFAFALAVLNGHQVALMCPTEILARQHHKTAQNLFLKFGIEVELLTSSITSEQRELTKQRLKNNTSKIVIGTHSLFSKDIEFCDLTLVVTDEQHRFGVNQRGAFQNKSGLTPDSIVLSATPIPRTLALTLYGDLEPLILSSRPKKATVHTRFVSSKTNEMYNYILNKAIEGEQTFIICPRVEEVDPQDEDYIDHEQDEFYELMSAKKLFKTLKSTQLAQYVGLLHGKMKDEQKISAMNDFASGKIKVLVTTTVVEVGIDVPNATTMVIYNAERYGLSQLHQLRGRIGRGSKSGYCFLLCTPESYLKRLKFFQECNDGFELSQKDLETRGAGDFLGTNQHGQSLTLSGQPITPQFLQQAKELSLHINISSQALSQSQQKFLKHLTLN